MLRIVAFLAVLAGTLAAGSAALAQSIFGESPPRPPADIPGGTFPPQPPPVQYPGQYPAQSPYPAQPATQPPSGGIEAQPLPPPQGVPAGPIARPEPGLPPQIPPPQVPPPQVPAPQRTHVNPPSAGAQPQTANAPQPAESAPPDDTVVTEMPAAKIANGRAVFDGLDKITGRIIKFDAAIGETVQFGALRVTARVCYTRPPTEPTNTDAFVEVDEVTLQGEIKRIFTGWMFASSPGLHAVEHPIYDVWLTDCGQPEEVAEPAPSQAAVTPPPARPHAQHRQRPASAPQAPAVPAGSQSPLR
jgi:hypothetical protein